MENKYSNEEKRFMENKYSNENLFMENKYCNEDSLFTEYIFSMTEDLFLEKTVQGGRIYAGKKY